MLCSIKTRKFWPIGIILFSESTVRIDHSLARTNNAFIHATANRYCLCWCYCHCEFMLMLLAIWFFFSFHLNKNHPRDFFTDQFFDKFFFDKISNQFFDKIKFWYKICYHNTSESILIFRWIITDFEMVTRFEQFLWAWYNIFASFFFFWMLCSEFILSFACIYFFLSPHLIPFFRFSLLRPNLASIEKCRWKSRAHFT